MKSFYIGTLFLTIFSYSAFCQVYEWDQLADFTGNARHGAVSFVIENEAYVGTGKSQDGTYYQDFYKYNATSDQWTPIADFPGAARYEAVAFSINGKGYVGTGSNGSGSLVDFYEYDPSTNNWSPVADFIGTARFSATAFAINGKGYVGTGNDGTGGTVDFFEYDPVTDNWASITGLENGNTRTNAVAFTINGKGYLTSGSYFDGSSTTVYSDIIEYDPVADNWTEKIFADIKLSNKQGAACFVVDNKAYLVAGSGNATTTVYDPSDNTLSTSTDFGPSTTEDNRNSLVAFALNDQGYAALGYYNEDFFTSIDRNDLWTMKEVVPPAAPSNIYFSNTTETTTTIYWTDNASDEESYEVYISTGDNLNYTLEASVAANTTSYGLTGLTAGTIYYVKIAAVKQGLSASAESYFTTDQPDLAAPSNLTVVPDSYYKQFNLSWNDNSGNEDGFIIERSIGDNSNFIALDTVIWSTTFSDDNLPKTDTLVTYRITAYVGNTTMSSEEVAIQTTALMPQAVDIIIDDIRYYYGSATIRFFPTRNRADGFVIQTATNAEFITIDTTFNSWISISLEEMQPLNFRLIYFNEYGVDTTSIVNVSPVLFPPYELKVDYVSNEIIGLKFQPISTNYEGTIIERKTGAGSFTVIDTLGALDNYYNYYYYYDSSVVQNETYTYRVRNFLKDITSIYKNSDVVETRLFGSWKKYNKKGFDETLDSLSSLSLAKKIHLNGKIYLLSPQTLSFLSLDMSNGTVETLPDFPGLQTMRFGSSFIHNNSIYIFNGLDANYSYYKTLFQFNTETNEWTQKASVPDGLNLDGSLYAVTDLGEGKVYLSGADENYNFAYAIYDIVSDDWLLTTTDEERAFAHFGFVNEDSVTFINNDNKNFVSVNKTSALVKHGDFSQNYFSDMTKELLCQYNGQNLAFISNKVYSYDDLGNFNYQFEGLLPEVPQNSHAIAFTKGDTLFYGLGQKYSVSVTSLYYHDVNTPVHPTAIHADSITGTTALLKWYNDDPKTEGFIVQQYVGDEYVTIDSTTHKQLKLESLEQNTYYKFRIYAYNGEHLSSPGEGGFTTERTVPYPVKNVTDTVLSATSIRLSWQIDERIPVDKQEIRYWIDGEIIFPLSNSDTTVVITGLPEHMRPYFSIYTSNEYGEAFYNHQASLTYLHAPVLKFVVKEDSGYTLLWTDRSKAETNYIVQRKAEDEENFVTLDSLEADVTRYTDINIASGVNYIYRLYATSLITNDKNELETLNTSLYSNELSSENAVLATDNVTKAAKTNVWPNPFSSAFTITVTGALRNTRATLHNLRGERVGILSRQERDNHTDTFIFSGPDLPAGIYFYRVMTEHGEVRGKVLKTE
ncbi:Kelch repeat-containing protein [Fulvivirga imtechensis AK7]|uniref:Kelch repeat-containing protein n=1 Tax=Fulvivirga imtechensis AK7 TaxID=1237149 RepID=L8JX03_9BACT|nr:fibronectin type III domain-containing protein [Fulvivirga imtechensis]ELR73606.1 Kelch repeat-containing protein [Fulvivirga imtechensis AK7]